MWTCVWIPDETNRYLLGSCVNLNITVDKCRTKMTVCKYLGQLPKQVDKGPFPKRVVQACVKCNSRHLKQKNEDINQLTLQSHPPPEREPPPIFE